MTFCLGMKVEEGLVGIADTRITTGTQRITARKVSIHEYGEHPIFVMTSGLRSVRDKALTYFEEVMEENEEPFDKLYKAVNSIARQIRRVAKEDKKALAEAGLRFNLHALVGGQLARDEEHKLYMLYPQGNWVEVSQGSPYYIIGESGYGKSLLDRVLRYDSPLDLALKGGCLAFEATRNSAIDVSYPLDVVLYRRDSHEIVEHRYEQSETAEMAEWWQRNMEESLIRAPADWMGDVLNKFSEKNVVFKTSQP